MIHQRCGCPRGFLPPPAEPPSYFCKYLLCPTHIASLDTVNPMMIGWFPNHILTRLSIMIKYTVPKKNQTPRPPLRAVEISGIFERDEK